MPATISTVLTSARLSSCAPVNTSKLGASAVSRLAAQAPTSADEDEAAAAPAVGQRDGDQRHQHAGPGDRQRHAEGLVGLVEGAGDGVAVLGQERAGEVGDQGDRGQRRQAAGLLGRERDRRHHGEQLQRRGRVGPGGGGVEARGGVGERASRRRATPGSAGTSVKNGTRTCSWPRGQAASVRRDSTIVACRRALVSGMPAIGPSNAFENAPSAVPSTATSASSSASRAVDVITVGVDRDQHRAPHVRHATASPSRGES